MSEILTWKRGDKFVREWSVTADKDLTGATLRMMFRKTKDGPVIIGKTLGVGTEIEITENTPGNRAFKVTIPGPDTNTGTFSLKADTDLVWDIELTYVDGDGPYTLTEGTAKITPDVTR